MLSDPKDIIIKQNSNGEFLISDDIIGSEFVMNKLSVSKGTAQKVIKKARELIEVNNTTYLDRGKTTLSSLYQLLGLKGKFY